MASVGKTFYFSDSVPIGRKKAALFSRRVNDERLSIYTDSLYVASELQEPD
ncbi:hypothetical protein [Brevibacillus reuszeri]|uniref:hypothetical protein n=1 Tax=Brevibacillus reuszeri TaxID=54915 RepID=UPI000A77AED8|nr:hypothetical protein [Brevibacillus reuszeri]MED1857041.1 hypothetical protein [Brevibacillus reuszeri]